MHGELNPTSKALSSLLPITCLSQLRIAKQNINNNFVVENTPYYVRLRATALLLSSQFQCNSSNPGRTSRVYIISHTSVAPEKPSLL